MEKNLKKRNNKSAVNVILTITLIVSLIVMTTFAVSNIMLMYKVDDITTTHQTAMEGGYEDNIYMASDGLAVVESDLSKLLIATSVGEKVMLASELSATASGVSSYVSKLPLSYEHTIPLQKFLHQVTEWGSVHAKAVAIGEEYDESEIIQSMLDTASQLRADISSTAVKFDGSYAVIDDLDDEGYYSNMLGTDEREYPSLVYDGLFSDELSQRTLRAVEDEMEIGEREVLTLVAENYGVQDGEIIGMTANDNVYNIAGNIGGKRADIAVTKRGGLLVLLDIDETPADVVYNITDAKSRALEVAGEYNYCDGLEVVWEAEAHGVAYVELAPVVDGVVFYTDLVKMRISLSTLNVIGVQAQAFCECYSVRELAYMMNEDAVATLVSSKLNILSVTPAVIPYGSGEKLCYEVVGTHKGIEYYIYLDGVSGAELKIYVVEHTENGRQLR